MMHTEYGPFTITFFDANGKEVERVMSYFHGHEDAQQWARGARSYFPPAVQFAVHVGDHSMPDWT